MKNKKFFIFLDQILVSGSNFLLGILLARFLGLDLFGQFSLIWLIVLFFSSIQLAFIISPMLTHGSKKIKLLKSHYLISIFYLQILFSIICTILLLLFLMLFYSLLTLNIEEYFYSIILLVFSFLGQDFMRRYLIIKESYFKLISIDFVSYIGQLGVISYLIYSNNLTLKNAILYIAIVFLLSYVFSLFFLEIKKIKQNYFILLILKNWKFSKWLVYSSLLQWGSGNLFILVAGYLLGPWAAGVIKVMQNLMGIFHVIFIALENILPIKFAEIYKKSGYENMYKYFIKHFRIGLLFIVCIVFVLILSYKELIFYIYGNEYVQYSYLLFGFMIMYLFIYTGMLQRYILRTIENTKIIFINYLYTTLFSTLSAYMLIKFFELDGVIIGMIITQVISNIIFYIEIKKINRNNHNV